MKVGHIYKKGKSYYLCYQGNKYGTVYLINLNTCEMTDIYGDGQKEYYTHIGKAIELIKRGVKNGQIG